MTLHVPNGTSKLYESIWPWGYFDIVEDDFSYDVAVLDGVNYMLLSPSRNAIVMSNKSSTRASLYEGDIQIPTEVEYQGVQYAVTSIGPNAFEECEQIKSVYLPSTIQTISDNAFASSSIDNLIVEENSQLKVIGDYAFEYCRELCCDLSQFGRLKKIGSRAFYGSQIPEKIDIPYTVTEISSNALSHWLDMTSVAVHWDEPISVDMDAFGDIERTKKATLYVPNGSKEKYEISYPWCNFGNIIEDESLHFTPILANALILTPSSWSGEEDSYFTIEAIITPENTTDKSLEWISSDEKIAKVNNKGVVRILSEGSCVISVSTLDGSNLHEECVITSMSGVDTLFGVSESINVYDMNGVQIKKDCDRESLKNLTPGIYMIRQGNRVQKVLIQ